MKNLTVKDLKKLMAKYPENYVVECGYEGLTFYKPVGDDKHDFVGKIDFGNENKRINNIFSDRK